MSVCHEVMIHDLDELGARLYFTGLIYVADTRRCAAPLYFAPYLAQSCVPSALTPEVTQAGVSWLSEVVQVIDVGFKQLFDFPEGFLPQEKVLKDTHWPSWMAGIMGWALRAERALRDRKDWDKRTQRVYFLGKPNKLGRLITKAPNQMALGAHFGRSLYELFTVSDLSKRDRA